MVLAKRKSRRSYTPTAFNLAPQVRFELTTLRLTAGCSAIELLRNIEPAPVKCRDGSGIFITNALHTVKRGTIQGRTLKENPTARFQTEPRLALPDEVREYLSPTRATEVNDV